MNKKKCNFKSVRRRSRSIGAIAANGLCKTIPKSLSPADRLEMLLEISFRHTFNIVQKELCMQEGMDSNEIWTKETGSWEKIKLSLKENKCCTSAVSDDTSTIEMSTSLNTMMSKCNEVIEKYEAEMRRWDELVLSHRNDLKNAVDSSSGSVSVDLKNNEELYDYSGTIQEAFSIHENTCNQVVEFSRKTAILANFLNVSKKLKSRLNEQTKQLKQESLESPRTLIRKICTPLK